MAEPARKHKEIEPDIRPKLYDVNNINDNAARRRASFKDLNAGESSPEKPNTDSVAEQEANGSNVVKGAWKDNTTGNQKNQSSGFVGSMKKKGAPIAIIMTLLGFGLVGIGGVAGSSLLLVNFKEVLSNKFNTQLTSMDIRSTRMLTQKMGTTKGICSSIITVACKYSTMSKKQLENFEKAGITVVSDGKTMFGRTKPAEFEFNGKTIKPEDFSSALKESPELRTAVKDAYNPKYAGFTDGIWDKVTGYFDISKKPTDLEGDGYDEKMDNLETDFEDANKLEKQPNLNEDDLNPDTGDPFSEGADELLDEANDQVDVVNELIEDAGGDGSVTSKLLNGADEIKNAVSLTGLADDGCTVYRTFRSLGYAAKTVRVIQLAYYATIFLKIADQIKAGDAKEEDVSFVGRILTSTSKDDLGEPKSATDSFGYRYAAYGDLGNMPTSAMQFMAAAGVSGMMINFFESFPKPMKVGCAVLGNPLVGIASVGGGLVYNFFTAGSGLQFNISRAAIVAAIKKGGLALLKSPGFWVGAGLAFAEAFLPGLLKDIIAGKMIDKTTVGADAGDAITSGASGIMGTTAKYGGNAPLTPDQAVAYSNLSNDIAAQYAEEDRLAYSPFDITNGNTFLGKIATTLIPYASKFSSLSGALSSIASITTGSLASLTSSNIKAASSAEYTMCQDFDYKAIGVATDPYCNVVYGIPPEALDVDPAEVANTLVSQNNIYESDGDGHKAGDIVPGSSYAKFVDDCINRIDPIGYESAGSDGSGCLFGASPDNKNFYIYYIDQRVQKGMDNEELVDSGSSSSDAGTETSSPDTTAFDSKTMKELAKMIIDSGNVNDRTGQIKQFAAGTRTDINIKVLKIIAELAEKNKFTISDLVRSKNASYGAKDSQHKVGLAVDFSGRVGINGVPIPLYSSYSKTIQTFVNEASQLLGDDCNQIGVPNTKYRDNAPASKCNIFFDPGTGTHIHIGVKA